jgi:hypothetical protein
MVSHKYGRRCNWDRLLVLICIQEVASRYGENLGECGKIVASDDEHLDKLEQVQVDQSPGVIAKLYEDAWGLQQGHDLFSFVVKDYQYKNCVVRGQMWILKIVANS